MTDVVADAYATMAQLRLHVRNAATTDATDADTGLELLALEAAARAIDRTCNRSFRITGSPSARVFTASPVLADWLMPSARHYVLAIDDVADTTGMTVEFDTSGDGDYTLAVTGYRVAPANAPARGRPYNRVIFDAGVWPPTYEEGVRVTAKWGWSAIPSAVTAANLVQAARFLKRRDAPFGIAGSADLGGTELRLLSKLDPDVAVMVGAYRSNWGAV